MFLAIIAALPLLKLNIIVVCDRLDSSIPALYRIPEFRLFWYHPLWGWWRSWSFFFSTKNWYLDSRVKLVEDEFDFVEPLSLVVWLFSSGVFEDFHSDDNGKLPVGTVFWMCFKNFGLKSTGWQCCFVWVLVSLKRKAL